MKAIVVWECPACGALLKTQKGVIQHQQRCKIIDEQLGGQLSMDDALKRMREAMERSEKTKEKVVNQ